MQNLAEPQRTRQWHVVHCRPLQESQVARILEQQLDLMVYLPIVKGYFRGRIQYAPLFPCYLFVYVACQSVSLSQINSMPGVLQLVTFGHVAQTVPDALIEELRERIAIFNQHGGLLNHSFRIGDAVRLKNGPFKGLEAIFQGPMQPSERVQILLELFGRAQEVQVFADILEPAEPTHSRRGRRTRGRGRAIKSRMATPAIARDEARDLY